MLNLKRRPGWRSLPADVMIRKKSIAKNNKGSAVVMVIIAVALVTILVAILMIMSALNLQMKYTERKAKRNFYTAEIAMEQIRAGLEGEVSAALETAYMSIQPTYASYTPVERETNFKSRYVALLRKGLKDTVDERYALNRLGAYLDPGYFDLGAGGNTKLSSTSGCKLEGLNSGLVLKGVKIEYTDAEGYLSIVETDFCLLIPDLKFSEYSLLPDLFSYSLIGSRGITDSADLTKGKISIENNVYAGPDGIVLQKNADWSFNKLERVVCKGTTKLEELSTLKVESTGTKSTNYWTDNIFLNSASASFDGRIYVADDLTLKGESSRAFLSGEYYGYGNGTELNADGTLKDNGDKSSAILLNGLNSTLDMSQLSGLFLSGRASLGTGGTEIDKPETGNPLLSGITVDDNENIPMGESIEIKSNQIAYLAPAECIGVFEGTALIGKNPMSAQDYRQLLTYKQDTANYPGFEEVSYQVPVESLGRTLNDYNADSSLKFRKIFQKAGNEVIVYYYLVLDEQNAGIWFKDYYAAQQNKLDTYMKRYMNEVKLNDKLSRLILGGNIVTYDGDEISLYNDDKILTAEELNKLNEEQLSYMKTFAGLGCKLVEDYDNLSAEEKTRDIFTNLVMESELPVIGQVYTMDIAEGSSFICGAVTSGDYVYGKTQHDAGMCLIVAGGDVTVSYNFTGLILAKGTIRIDNSAGAVTIKGNRENLIKMLQHPINPEGDTIIKTYFKSGEEYILEGTSLQAKDTNSSDKYINITDYVQFANWKKE
ncbi:hypothetical protein EDD76_11411 [Kineothrix alysoides]|uniref:Uncharacterized protein n=2 Tax=Kineothrix alysoides TaxID=1469948 RepID=A0A4V2QBA2_9FIRM|nr:hypothetical protein EDD76_11411 [Kineothrix alysoides]